MRVCGRALKQLIVPAFIEHALNVRVRLKDIEDGAEVVEICIVLNELLPERIGRVLEEGVLLLLLVKFGLLFID